MRDLSRLTRVREIWEQRERARVAAALAAQRMAVEHAEQAHAAHRQALAMDGMVDPLLTFVARTATHERRIEAEQELSHAAVQTEASRGVWRRAKQDLDIAENLEERRRAAIEAGLMRTEINTLDELATIRHGRAS